MSIQHHFEEWPKMARLSKDCLITEKIDGTNAQVLILPDGQVLAGSRTRMITPEDDNFGFARWVKDNEDALREALGEGRHFGEWWGAGIQRRYGQSIKRFSLFHADRWAHVHESGIEGLSVVPLLYKGPFHTQAVEDAMTFLREKGSAAAPGFMNPEGVIVYHVAARIGFKKTFDDAHKGGQP